MFALLSRDTVIRFIFLVIRPYGWLPSRPSARSTTEGKRLPVLVVVGPGLNTASAIPLRLFLRKRDWHWLWSVRVRGSSIAQQAQEVEKNVARLLNETQTTKIDIVAHGAAGLAVAWYIRHSKHAICVRRLVTLSTPWNGTRMAVFGGWSKQLGELLPDAHSLDELQELSTPTFSIWSQDDPLIVPSSSASPQWAHAVGIDGIGHFEMLVSPRALRAVQAALNEPLTGPAS